MSENKLTKEQWFDHFLSAYKGSIQRTTIYLVKNPDAAEDIQQEIYCKVWTYAEKMMTLDPKAMETYLKHIIRSCVADYFRSKDNHLILKPGMSLEGRSIRGDALCQDDPQNHIVFREYLKSIKRIDQKSRELLQMRIIYGAPFKEIGRRLGISEAAARKRYERITAKLKEKERREK